MNDNTNLVQLFIKVLYFLATEALGTFVNTIIETINILRKQWSLL